MDTPKTPQSHIEEAILLFDKLRFYDIDIYQDIVESLLREHRIVEKWQMRGFWKLMKSVIFKDVPLCYAIINNELSIKPFIEGKTGKEYKLLPNIDAEIKDNVKNIPISLRALIIPIAKALYCSRIVFDVPKNENPAWKEDFYEVAKEEDLKKVRYMIEYALYSIEKNTLSSFFNRINASFYYHLIKSLLNAEYLLLENYTVLLDKILNCDINADKEVYFIVPKVILPYQIKSFILLAQHEKEMCFRIRQILEKTGVNRIEVDLQSEEYANEKLKDKILIGEKETSALGKLVKSVIDMTMIDHSFKTNDSNINKLVILLSRLDTVKQIKFADSKFESVLDMVRVKASTMLYSMLIQKPKFIDIQYYFTSGILHDIDLLPVLKAQMNKFDIAARKNIYVNRRLDNLGKKVVLNDLREKIEVYDKEKRKDVLSYNECVRKGLNNYENMSSIIDQMNTKPDSTEVINAINDFHNIHKEANDFTPAFFLKAFEYIDNYIVYIKEQDNSAEQANLPILLLSQLLASFRKYILKYQHSVPARYLPAFAYSFYQKDPREIYDHTPISIEDINQYDYHQFDFKFFFASLHCSPLNITYLSSIYEMYTNTNHEYSLWYYSEMNTLLIGGLKKDIQEINQEWQQQTENLNIKIEDFNKKTEDKTQEIVQSAAKENEELRHQTMQLLGIFAAFLAFVTIAVGASQVAHSAIEFTILSFAYTLGLTVFVSLIKVHKKEEIEKFPLWRKKIHNWEKYILFSTLLIGLAVTIPIYYANQEKKKDANTESASTDTDQKVIKGTASYDIKKKENTSTPSVSENSHRREEHSTSHCCPTEKYNQISSIQEKDSSIMK